MKVEVGEWIWSGVVSSCGVVVVECGLVVRYRLGCDELLGTPECVYMFLAS